MNIVVYCGIWILCGCIVSIFVYHLDEKKEHREEIYITNSYIFFMVLFWPITVYFFFRFIIATLTSKKQRGKNDK